MEILIEKDRIYPYAIRISEQIAKMSGTSGSHLTITKDNYPLLDSYIEMAISDGEAILYKQIGKSNNFSLEASSQNILFVIKNVKRINEDLAGLIKTQIMMYCCNAIIAMWIAPNNSDLSTQYKQNAAGNLKAVSDAFLFRSNYLVDEYDYSDRNSESIQSKSDEDLDGKETPLKDKESTKETSESDYNAVRIQDHEDHSLLSDTDTSMRNKDTISEDKNDGTESELKKDDQYVWNENVSVQTENKMKDSESTSGNIELHTENRVNDMAYDEAKSAIDYQEKMADDKIIDRNPKREIITCCPFKS